MAIQQCQSTEDKKSMANQSENASTVCHIHAHRHGQTSRRGGSKGIKHHLIRFISARYWHSVDLTCADAVLTATVVHCLLWSSSLCCPVSRRSLCWSTSAVNRSTVKLRAGLSSTSPRRHSSSRCCMKYNCSSTESSYSCQPVTPTTITAAPLSLHTPANQSHTQPSLQWRQYWLVWMTADESWKWLVSVLLQSVLWHNHVEIDAT